MSKQKVRMRLALALGLMAALTAGPTLVAQDATLSKPLTRFTVGDIFPRLGTESFADTGRRWSETAGELLRLADERKRLVADAIKSKKGELPAMKKQLKEANSEKDFVKAGTLEGTLTDSQIVLEVLKRITALSERQAALADGFKAVGDAMEKYSAADAAFDPFRGQGISRPGAGEPDRRLGAEGYKAYKSQAEALATLGDAFSELGAQVEDLSSARMKVLSALERGGNIQAPQ